MQKVNTEDSFQGKKHTIEIHIKMWRYKYKKNKAKQADIIKLAGQSESLAGLSESLAGLSDLGSNLPRLTTWVGRVLLYPGDYKEFQNFIYPIRVPHKMKKKISEWKKH